MSGGMGEGEVCRDCKRENCGFRGRLKGMGRFKCGFKEGKKEAE